MEREGPLFDRITMLDLVDNCRKRLVGALDAIDAVLLRERADDVATELSEQFRAGNVVRYTVTRRCSQEAAGLHSVYVTVTAMYRTAAPWQAYRDRMRAEARKQQEPADRVSPTPTPTAKPTPPP